MRKVLILVSFSWLQARMLQVTIYILKAKAEFFIAIKEKRYTGKLAFKLPSVTDLFLSN